ncbi:glutathione peroxidase [Aerococcaceae bacterium zg-ZUI334]|uniref:glutathione peroxidase n=1 Tax=Aerococcaceae TaxID=186827 RepID=UPI0013BDE482|nr:MULTISPECIES: glutathione peroxidase [unclassified Facklamia]MBR7927416.1 glutathione peroxidase [Aerococcaceae bacterium zg-ZUI334]NEW64146.1 glutathione peroxidase [Facklamia sp. 252]NEW67603.1 glutathione peroxidase [Facklamia sp. 253]QQD65852.1 glutathione peroxidase [Aerococcaceae bacterium zg-252]
MALPNILLTRSNGETYPLHDYCSHVLLVVNTATGCGLAPQMNELETLYQTYKEQKFSVLGFPSNQFKQEKVSDDEMVSTCQLTFGTTFPLHQTVQVNGEQTAPIFQWLKSECRGLLSEDIKWNFTKFLINRKGQVIKRYAPTTSPKSIAKDIEKALKA